MAAVALAWESQSTRRVGCSAVARQAARFTAVVVLPTPPFWFATAMIRAKYSPESENLAKSSQGCKMFHVEQPFDSEKSGFGGRIVQCETLFCHPIAPLRHSAIRVCAFLDSERSGGGFPRLSLRVDSDSLEIRGGARCSTWNTDPPRHLQTFGTLPCEAFCRRGAGSECSTWNIDLARAANGCESGEFLKEIAETSPLYGVVTVIADFFVPTRRRRRRECGTSMGSLQSQVRIF